MIGDIIIFTDLFINLFLLNKKLSENSGEGLDAGVEIFHVSQKSFNK